MTDSAVPEMRPAADTRRGWAVDIAIALAVTAIQLVTAATGLAWQHGGHSAADWPTYLLLTVGGMALVARRRFPVAVLAVSLATTLWVGAMGQSGLIWLGLIVAFFSAVLAGKRTAAVASLVVGYLVSFWPPWQVGRPGRASTALALGLAAWLLVLLAAAEVIRIRSQRAAALQRSREEQLRRRAGEERLRIARDLHDVVAHNISVINVQANTALHLMDRQPERAREALTAIHDVSRQALAELRSVLGVLRDGEPIGSAPRAPSPGLGNLPDLLAAVSFAGLEVRLATDGKPRQLPAEADITAYRIVQESLTNVTRHSRAATASVTIGYEPRGVLVQVEDPGPARTVASRATGGKAGSASRDGAMREAGAGLSAGNGIPGMTERARALDGTVTAGLLPDGGFSVSAWLPAPAAPQSSGEDAAAPAGADRGRS